MRIFQELNQNVIMFERFDASHGLSNVESRMHVALFKTLGKRQGQDRVNTSSVLRSEEQEKKEFVRGSWNSHCYRLS